MRKLIQDPLSIFLFIFFSLFTTGRVYSQRPDKGKSDNIAERLDSLINSSSVLKNTEVGVIVYDLTAKSDIFRYQAEKLYRPASVEKVITTVTALSVLGKDYKINTSLSYSGHLEGDTLHGNLYVKGDFDPEFMEEDMKTMVESVVSSGIKYVKGRVVGDVSMMDSVYWGPGWAWDDSPESFQPYLSPLMLNRGCIGVTISPTAKGSRPEVTLSPETDFFTIDNRSICGVPSKGAARITRNWMYNDNTIIVSGNVKSKESTLLNVFDSKDYFLRTFRYQLQQRGVYASADSIDFGTVPLEAKNIYTVGRDIKEVLKQALKESDNLSAEALFFHATRNICGGRKYLSHKDGQKAIYRFLDTEIGMKSSNYNIVDGSGVSGYNYISPELILSYLKYAFSSPFIFHPFYDSLPIAGIDGTLKYRMRKGKSFRNVRAKTGTLTGVSSLAGYVNNVSGHTLAFVIINQNVIKAGAARRFQDSVCEILATTGI